MANPMPAAWMVTYDRGSSVEVFVREQDARRQAHDLDENGWLDVKCEPLFTAEALTKYLEEKP